MKIGLLIESCVNGSGKASQRVDRTRDSSKVICSKAVTAADSRAGCRNSTAARNMLSSWIITYRRRWKRTDPMEVGENCSDGEKEI